MPDQQFLCLGTACDLPGLRSSAVTGFNGFVHLITKEGGFVVEQVNTLYKLNNRIGRARVRAECVGTRCRRSKCVVAACEDDIVFFIADIFTHFQPTEIFHWHFCYSCFIKRTRSLLFAEQESSSRNFVLHGKAMNGQVIVFKNLFRRSVGEGMKDEFEV